MNIEELIERSKTSYEEDPDKLACEYTKEPLVSVQSKPTLKLDPIWENPIDEREAPIYRQYVQDNPSYSSIYLRKNVAERLYAASRNLPEHWRLVLREGYRPLAVQYKLLQALIDEYLLDKPDAKTDRALVHARTYVSDPEIALPPHCCGAAVDIESIDTKTGSLIDFGCPLNTPSEISFLHSKMTTKAQYTNRITLLTAMLKAGFAPCYTEWWHFSYGDTVWAYFYNKTLSVYGPTELDLRNK